MAPSFLNAVTPKDLQTPCALTIPPETARRRLTKSTFFFFETSAANIRGGGGEIARESLYGRRETNVRAERVSLSANILYVIIFYSFCFASSTSFPFTPRLDIISISFSYFSFFFLTPSPRRRRPPRPPKAHFNVNSFRSCQPLKPPPSFFQTFFFNFSIKLVKKKRNMFRRRHKKHYSLSYV